MSSLAVRSPDLAQALTRLRKDAGLERAEAGRRARCSHQTVWRAERTGVCSRKILLRLLDAYGVADPAERERLLSLADQARQPAWWDNYGLGVPTESVIAAEAGAVAKMAWELTYIPGLLQTPDYARAVILAGPGSPSPAETGKLVQVRMERKEALHAGRLHLTAIAAEAALHCAVGGPAVMRAQLEHLRRAAGRPNVTLRILPCAAGAHPGMTGAFAILSYRTGQDVLYYDTPGGAFYVDDADRVERARWTFSRLAALALPPDETMNVLTEVVRQF